MKDWEGLSQEARETMEWLGDFGPTVHVEQRQIKGYMRDSEGGGCKVYLTSDDLRILSRSFLDVADWLDARVKEKTAT